MAVMNKCCCCGVRSGSIASAIYSLVLAIIGLGYFAYSVKQLPALITAIENAGIDVDDRIYGALYASFYFACIMFVILIVACIFVLIGISTNSKGMLIPFMFAQGLHFLWYIIEFSVEVVFVTQLADLKTVADGLKVTLGIFIVLASVDIVCLLCVISQYQEYKDGRGR